MKKKTSTMESVLNFVSVVLLMIYSSFLLTSPLNMCVTTSVAQTIIEGQVLATSTKQTEATTFSDILGYTATEPTWESSTQSESVVLTSSNSVIDPMSQGNPTVDNPSENSGVPNCSPWFSCVHGVCTGGMSCTCFDGWAGLFCDVKCPLDCFPHGICVTSSVNEPMCICNSTSIYVPEVGCVSNTQASTVSTTENTISATLNMRPQWERECFGSFTCVHGYCQTASLSCECDVGWKGQLCDQKCDLDCGSHGRCRENPEYTLICECENSYHGDHCENANWNSNDTSTIALETPLLTTIIPWDFNAWFNVPTAAPWKPASETTNPNPGLKYDGVSINTGMTTKTRSKVDRICFPGFECKNGYCVREPLSCKCDKGWGGPFCSDLCNLSCGDKGTCLVPEAGSPYCECTEGDDTGYDCGRHDDPQTTADKTASESQTTTNKIAATLQNTKNKIVSTPQTTTDKTVSTSQTTTNNTASTSQTTTNNTASTHAAVSKSSFLETDFTDLEEIYGPLPPLAQRVCLAGLLCAYGNCAFTADNAARCECQADFTGYFCEKKCPVDCGQRGKCNHNEVNNTIECECYPGYSGFNCTDTWSDHSSSPVLLVLGVVAGLFLLFILLFVIVPILLYRRRNIAIMKIVYWFQPFEEDDNREYDAFVSYASTDQDRQFVLQVLVPKLEGRMCFTLCIHQRNFVPGQYIVDNIVESVKRSRRTLLIISPSFVNSGWCRFEYQTALQEMLNEKHRVLPIIIGDISSIKDNKDETLKRILNTITWLEYPNRNASEQDFEKFWKRLQLSMPKKRPSQTESGRSHSCLVSQSAHLSLQLFKFDKPLPNGTSFTNKGANSRPMQRIVRVPAYEFDSSEKIKVSPALENILETHEDIHSQTGITGSSSGETTPHLQSSEPSLAFDINDDVSNVSLECSETRQSNGDSESRVLDSAKTDLQTPLQNFEDVVESQEIEDIHTFTLDNCIGDIKLEDSSKL